MKKYFGTDGIRGVANVSLTNEMVYKATKATIKLLADSSIEKTFIIGKDTRISSDMFEATIVAAVISEGFDVVKLGVVPTPAISYILKKGSYIGGVMISASHNSYEYNGIKFFDSCGHKLSDDDELKIEKLMDSDYSADIKNAELGKVSDDYQLKNVYIENIKSVVGKRKINKKILIDCSNGSNYMIAEQLYKQLGADVKIINNTPNGVNINKNCGSTHLDMLKSEMLKGDFDFAFAFDGDADRVLFIDKKANLVDGDKISTIIALDMINNNMLNSNKIVLTKMSNLGVINYLKDHEISVDIVDIGDRYVLERIIENNYSIGAEQSGHIILYDYNNTGDGLLTSVVLINSLLNLGKDLENYSEEIVKYPQVLVNLKVDSEKKKNYLNIDEINKRIKEIEKDLDGNGRVFIRLSGTEPLIRIMLEGLNSNKINNYAEELKELYKKYLV